MLRYREADRKSRQLILNEFCSTTGYNWHLRRWCKDNQIQLTRGRPYKKDDNAHIEQKNWTHVRKLLGWERYDSPAAVAAINDLYRRELRRMRG